MTIALILPVRDHWDYALRAADSFLASAPEGKVIVCDDASKSLPARFGAGDPKRLAWFSSGTSRGLTYQWNRGLRAAREIGADYAICGNSDTVFTAPGLERACVVAETSDLLGPVTNCPGWGCGKRQLVSEYLPDYELRDDGPYLNQVAERLNGPTWREKPLPVALAGIEIRPGTEGVVATVPAMLNGFTMLARTETWWSGAWDKDHVFNPKLPMQHNELELQLRWAAMGRRFAVCPSWFVFHYRAVTRGDAYLCEGAYRKSVEREA